MTDNTAEYKKYDTQNICEANELLPEQVRVAWDGTRELKVPKSYSQVRNIVFIGMGGSGLGADLIKGSIFSRLKVPFELFRGYNLPGYVDKNSLVILSSFSGSTEEVLHASKVAKERGAKRFVIASGSKLAAYAKREKIPSYIFVPGELAKQPRLGLGFSVVGVLGFLQKAGLVKISAKEVKAMQEAMNDVVDSCAVDVHSKENPAKIVAEALMQRAVLVVGAQHLTGNAHVLTNQINESGKQFAMYLTLPELNHHFMEGLTYPKKFFSQFTVLMIKSKLYHPRVQKRFDITAEVFENQGGDVVEYTANGETLLEEMGELLQFGSFMSCYMAVLNKVDPYHIPFVDWFKEKMGK
ncbi:MAG: SIS domain-containing protein [Patescibacteria group bacterium]